MSGTAKYISGFLIASCLYSPNALAHSPTYVYEGLFAGSLICESGEIGVLFHIEEAGQISRGDFDRVMGTCRSGSGSCNITHDLKYVGTRKVKGTLDFFPTASNPKTLKTLKTRFEITGTGTRQETEVQSKMAVLNPELVQIYLEISSVITPDFPTDISGLEFKINISSPLAKPPYNKMFSQVSGHQCHNLTLSRLKEPKP
ncbi:MAG: hypothetical protein L3J65_01840 [Robiginitomaculum sp.]|nr:hypothetical protein [Robiginitomaculum sp.]